MKKRMNNSETIFGGCQKDMNRVYRCGEKGKLFVKVKEYDLEMFFLEKLLFNKKNNYGISS